MWSSIANLKENLNKIALDVHEGDDDDEELGIYGTANGEGYAVHDRRNSHSFAHSKSASSSPMANGVAFAHIPEIEQYKAEIERLRASEAEIKALSVNYAALLKEKEDQILRLDKENGSLKQNLEATNAALDVARNEGSKASTNGIGTLKGSGNQAFNRPHKFTNQRRSHHAGNQIHSNGIMHANESDVMKSKTEPGHSNLQAKDKELADLAEYKNSSGGPAQITAEIRQLRWELEQERNRLANVQQRFQEENTLKEAFQEELKLLKIERDKISKEMSKIHNELNDKVSRIKQLQMELNRREAEEGRSCVDNLKSVIMTLEKENSKLKMEKNELEAALEMSRKPLTCSDTSKIPNNDSTFANEMVDSSRSFPGKDEMELAMQKLNKDLKETQHQRDKALQELTRLKQHLLDKESEESEKMDEDSKIIEELQESNEYLRVQISLSENALKQAIANHEEFRMTNINEIQRLREIIDDLNKKLASYTSTIDAKNIELLNLQTALGQYYAEIEAKEHLEGELARAREESVKLSQLLKDANHQVEVSRGEKEQLLAKVSQAERTEAEWKARVYKLEEDTLKLRQALEQSMKRLNRMSVDSDYLVDRRIVIKLLVTYMQRNHSKEVLDLMVRMLGFSEEDKQRIGVAQQGVGKGVVRGVLGLPSRLVGGLLGGGSTEAAANMASDDQSFADLWVDFLLKETEEREKRELARDTGKSVEEALGRFPDAVTATPSPSNQRMSFGSSY